ncbi:rodlet layer protein [Streptacidiphilus sp. PB12-B1b]|uniref:rodlet layer protein n=1 Tax=Streptacidiphilus sp. PB12-B1b TaxID=2705012 RepID=UPI0015F9D5FD|nr:rodlet layer protein [Streptacidiphilus sp. PB12-B1b]QMU79514.1 rodlet layer protein [Streptacidiphilus sp. PB12-B1b]
MIKQTLSVVGLAMTAAALVVSPAAAIGNSDGTTNSLQGAGGTNVTGTHGHNSPSHHTLENTNLCLPEVHHAQVGVLVPVQADVPVADQQLHQTCQSGQGTQGAGDGAVSHLLG